MIPNNVIACQIKYGVFKFRCNTFRTRRENLAGAWKMLVNFCHKHNYIIPNKEIFLKFGGEVTYYRSF